MGGGVLYEKFKVWASRVCIFVEYLPRFYRLHFRVTQYENRYSLPLFADQVKDDLAPHEKGKSSSPFLFFSFLFFLFSCILII